MQLDEYSDFLAPDDIRIKGHRIGASRCEPKNKSNAGHVDLFSHFGKKFCILIYIDRSSKIINKHFPQNARFHYI